MKETRLPSLFIGSAVESLDVAYAIQANLEFDFEATVWAQAVFTNALPTVTHLKTALDAADFAAFILSPDDELVSRDKTIRVARDNVVFELGLSLALHGPKRTFIIKPHDVDVHIPSDLNGLSTLGYRALRRDRNMTAALGPACHIIRTEGRTAGAIGRVEKSKGHQDRDFLSLENFIEAWNSSPLLEARAAIRSIVLDIYSDEFATVRQQLYQIFTFLDSLADAVLLGQINSAEAKHHFGTAVLSVWPHAATLLAPPNGGEIWENHTPSLARLFKQWGDST